MSMADEAGGRLARLRAFASEGGIAWPEGEGIETQGDRTRGWSGPYLAGTYLLVADAGRNLAEDWEECRPWYHDKTDEQCAAMRDYYLAHRDLFRAQAYLDLHWCNDGHRLAETREALTADIRALLAERDALAARRSADEARLAAADKLALEVAGWAQEPYGGVNDEERYDGAISAWEDRIIDAWHDYEVLTARTGTGEG